MTPRERELLQGIGNCYHACEEDFENTVYMVARSRGRTEKDVKETLREMREKYSEDPQYVELRNRLPSDFPL